MREYIERACKSDGVRGGKSGRGRGGESRCGRGRGDESGRRRGKGSVWWREIKRDNEGAAVGKR